MLQHVSVSINLVSNQIVVSGPKPLPLTRLLSGANQSQVLDKLRLLFPVCKAAHCIAVLNGFEYYENSQVDLNLLAERNQLINIEALHEQLWLLCVELPRMYGMPDKVAEFAGLSQRIKGLCNQMLHAMLAIASGELVGRNHYVLEHSSQVSHLLDEMGTFYGQHFLRENEGLYGPLYEKIRALDWIHKDGKQGNLIELFEQRCRFVEHLRHESAAVLSDHTVQRLNDGIISTVETARGQLRYDLRLNTVEGETRIEHIQSYSPTDLHFAKNGEVYTVLKDMVELDLDYKLERAQVLVRLFNPCCAYQVVSH